MWTQYWRFSGAQLPALLIPAPLRSAAGLCARIAWDTAREGDALLGHEDVGCLSPRVCSKARLGWSEYFGFKSLFCGFGLVSEAEVIEGGRSPISSNVQANI